MRINKGDTGQIDNGVPFSKYTPVSPRFVARYMRAATKSSNYTTRGNLVAVVSNGTAVLGWATFAPRIPRINTN